MITYKIITVPYIVQAIESRQYNCIKGNVETEDITISKGEKLLACQALDVNNNKIVLIFNTQYMIPFMFSTSNVFYSWKIECKAAEGVINTFIDCFNRTLEGIQLVKNNG